MKNIAYSRVSALTLCLWASLSACSKPEPIALQLKAKSTTAQKASADVSTRSDCKASNGQILEFCQTGTPVECQQKERGEYCTQYTSGSNGRMWGPL
jgi:hypothetical protein